MGKAINVLIVEDETVIAARISLELDELGYEVSGTVTRAEQAIAHCQQHPPDVILLDVKLKGSMDGIELAQVLNEQNPIPIIYLTSNVDDATFHRAKKTLPYAFISKPYKKLDLQRAMELVVQRLQNEQIAALENPGSKEKYILSDRIFVRVKDKMVKVNIQDILFVKADGNYSLIHTDQKDYLLSVTLKTLEQNLPETHFIRTHRSFVVNLQKVDALHDNQEYLTVGSHDPIPISRRFKPEVMERLRFF